MKIIKMSDIFTDWLSGDGIFTDLTTFDVPWAVSDIETLNLDYHGNRCERVISPLVERLLTNDELTNSNRQKLSKIIYNRFGKNWGFEYNALFAEYNPIENYDRNEETTNTTLFDSQMKRDNSGSDTVTNSGSDIVSNSGTDNTTRTGSNTLNRTGKDTDRTNGVIEKKRTGIDTNEEQTTGFNSSEYVNSKKTVNTPNTTETESQNNVRVEHEKASTDTTTTTDTESIVHGLETTTTHGLEQKTEFGSSNTDKHTGTDKMTTVSRVHGNVGVTTNQQMIQSEIELRKKTFFEIVFRDIDSILTCSVFY